MLEEDRQARSPAARTLRAEAEQPCASGAQGLGIRRLLKDGTPNMHVGAVLESLLALHQVRLCRGRRAPIA